MYQLYFPAEALRPFIECYWMACASAENPITLQENVFVDGKASILFNFGVPYQRSRLGLDSLTLEQAMPLSNLDAQRLYPVAIQQQGQVDLVAVQFHPGGLAAFSAVPAYELTDLTMAVSDGLGREGDELEGRLFDCRDNPHEQIALLDTFFLRRLYMQTPSHGTTAQLIARQIEQSSGQISIRDLSETIGYSIRSIDRYFRAVYGFSPKFYTRIVRFQRALALMIQNPERPLLEIAYACGYYDPSHFNKEFADFTGRSPKQYRAHVVAKAVTPPPNLSALLPDGHGDS